MTHEAQRFLALNAVLHGYPALEAFDNSAEEMAKALGTTEEEAKSLSDAIYNLPQDEELLSDPMVRVFLNFYRNNSYTFVAMGDTIFPLYRFVINDREGQVNGELRELFLTNLLKDVTDNAGFPYPYIADGVLHCTPEDFQRVSAAMAQAYQLYLGGPKGAPKSLVSVLLKYTSLDDYSRVSASQLLKTFRQMAKSKRNPTIYQHTLLQTPDLMNTYKRTGCIMAFSDTTGTNLNWLLDVANVADSTIVLPVSMDTLKNYLLRDVRDLSEIKAMRKGNDAGVIMFPGVVA